MGESLPIGLTGECRLGTQKTTLGVGVGGVDRGAVMKVRLHPVNLASALSLCPRPPAHSIRCFPRHPAPCFTVLPVGSTSNTENKTADPFSELSERPGDMDQQKRKAREMDKINFSLGNAV